jgi:hypothetical protein
MLSNPFTPSEIASLPEDFFGRKYELDLMQRSLAKGSVAIQGAVGIGKSSLLCRVRLIMEGFDSDRKCHSVVAVGNKDIQSVDDAARLLLDRFVQCDETHNKVRIALPKILEFESGSICRFFKEGRHLDVLTRLIEEHRFPGGDLLLLTIDEADRCPVPIARLVRSLTTYIQHGGIKNVRFALAGVSPYFQLMVDEDSGINRFFYKALTLMPLPDEEAQELVESKLADVTKNAEDKKLSLVIEPTIIERIVRLSGGHPHLLQLLGSHLVEHENEDPDGVLDSRDLFGALRTICYEDRARVYDSILHTLDLEGRLEPLRKLLLIASGTCPTRFSRSIAQEEVGSEVLDWLVTRNVLTLPSDDEYGLVDEFLRIRLFLDSVAEQESEEVSGGPEAMLLEEGRYIPEQDEWRQRRQEDKEAEDEGGS